jgi:hypothetical protein
MKDWTNECVNKWMNKEINNWKRKKETNIYIYIYVYIYLVFSGMGKEVENLIMENNELLATKYVFLWIAVRLFRENVTVLVIWCQMWLERLPVVLTSAYVL